MTEGFTGTGARRLHYLQWGSGEQLIIAFHGYSNNAGIYSVLAQHLPAGYRLVSIDLPFHGQSGWKGQPPLQKQELRAMIDELRGHSRRKIFLSGFSLGGRIALTALEQMPDQISGAFLLSPDGLVPNPVYRFVTKNPVGRALFQRMIADPARHLKLVDWLRRKGWVDAGRQQFVTYFLGSQHSREFLGNAWPAVQELVPSIPGVRAAIETYKIPVHLFMGKWDQVIPPKNAAAFARDSRQIKIHLLDKGHHVLDAETARSIAQMLPPA